jgi:arylamine N-acetyltransferase
MDLRLRVQRDADAEEPSGDGFVMQAKCGDSWRSLYAFDLQEQLLADYEVVNWYLCNNLSSHFVTGLVAARLDREADTRSAATS